MIFDVIIGLFGSFFRLLTEGIVMIFVSLINLVAVAIEALICIFVPEFSFGRIQRKKRGAKSTASALGAVLTLLLIVGTVVFFVVAPKAMNREVTLVAEDGHSLPFVALIIHTKNGKAHERTDNAGNIEIPRFSTTSITVKDPRYVEKTWEKSEIESELIVERTVLGSGLDFLADKLLKPANK